MHYAVGGRPPYTGPKLPDDLPQSPHAYTASHTHGLIARP